MINYEIIIDNYVITLAIISIFVIVTWQYISIKGQKIDLAYLNKHNQELIAKTEYLEDEKLDNIRQIQRLTSEVQHLNNLVSEIKISQNKAQESAKAALFDLGTNLSKNLIETHRRESQEIREESEKKIATTTEKFHLEFERIVGLVSALNRDVAQSIDTSNLIKQSLLSPSGAGNLAEITLENILKNSGLRSNLDFIMQYSMMAEDNSGRRPDAVIFLPGNNLMVIDAKASKFLVEDITKDSSDLMRTMNGHLKQLSSREYAENLWLGTVLKEKEVNNIITLMFLPSEHAVEKIIEADSNFIHKAWAQNIFPVGPSGLMNMLSFAKFQISDYMRAENHKQIVEEIRKLLGSVAAISEHASKVSGNIQSLVSNFDKFAGSFNRNFLAKAKSIQKLGIVASSKNNMQIIERFELVSSKSELIEIEAEEPRQLEEI